MTPVQPTKGVDIDIARPVLIMAVYVYDLIKGFGILLDRMN